MKFSRYNQPKRRNGGRKPSAATIAKREAERAAELAREQEAFEAFETAETGNFNGFSFPTVFHRKYDFSKALEVIRSDDCADVETSKGFTIHAGADDISVYVLTEEAIYGKIKKRVRFNRSVYVF